ncbi:hypothetical protein SBADM41S_08095 [Streptomyces badius]
MSRKRGTGIVVTIEDSGLKMADAAMRRAGADAVAGRTDRPRGPPPGHTPRSRRGWGRLALKHRISVNYRPSSRGGTGVVVLLPRHLIAQESRESHAVAPGLREAAAPTAAAPASVPAPASAPAPPLRPSSPRPRPRSRRNPCRPHPRP